MDEAWDLLEENEETMDVVKCYVKHEVERKKERYHDISRKRRP